MKKNICLILASFLALGALASNPSRAQVSGEASQEVLEGGRPEMDGKIQDLRAEPEEPQTLEQKEEELEQELQIRPEGPRFEEVPGPDEALGLDDNLPVQPANEEVEIKF